MFAAGTFGAAMIMSGNATTNIYRVYGGDAKSRTPINPNRISNLRSAVGLPFNGHSGAFNTGQFVIEGT